MTRFKRNIPEGRRGDLMFVQWVRNGFMPNTLAPDGDDERAVYDYAKQKEINDALAAKLRIKRPSREAP